MNTRKPSCRRPTTKALTAFLDQADGNNANLNKLRSLFRGILDAADRQDVKVFLTLVNQVHFLLSRFGSRLSWGDLNMADMGISVDLQMELWSALPKTVRVFCSVALDAYRSQPDFEDDPALPPALQPIKGMQGKGAFPLDWLACLTWCQMRGLTPICDKAVESIVLRSIQSWNDATRGYLNFVSKIPVASFLELEQRCAEDPSIVWISAGTPMGLVLAQRDVCKRLLHRYTVGVVAASCFNWGYSGLRIHAWNADKLGRTKAKFCCGETLD